MTQLIRRILFYELPGNILKGVRKQIMEDNRRFVIIWSSFQLLYWLYCLIMSAHMPDFMRCRGVYAVSFAVCAAALLAASLAAPRASWLIIPSAIAVDVAVLWAGIGIARVLAPKTIVIFASVLIVPVFFICDTLSTLLLLILNAALFAVVGMNSMSADVFRWTLNNLIIFSSVGLVLGYFVNKARFERYIFAESAVQLAESNAKLAQLQTVNAFYDQLTSLHNRRAFAEKNDQLRENMPSGCCVVIADINGLKKMNDTCGHDAGDELIIGTADCLRYGFPDKESIYRIGGDEFCVILNGTADEVEKYLKRFEAACRSWQGKYVNRISVSCGYASDREFDRFDSMLKAADQRMYEAKSEYYRTSGEDRHRR